MLAELAELAAPAARGRGVSGGCESFRGGKATSRYQSEIGDLAANFERFRLAALRFTQDFFSRVLINGEAYDGEKAS